MAVKKTTKTTKPAKKTPEPAAPSESNISDAIADLQLEELVSLKGDVEKLIAQKKKEKKKEIYANMLELAKTAGFDSVEDFMGSQKGRTARSDKGVKLPPKYQNDDDGKTWSGKGRSPNWVNEHLKNGGDLEDLLIEIPYD